MQSDVSCAAFPYNECATHSIRALCVQVPSVSLSLQHVKSLSGDSAACFLSMYLGSDAGYIWQTVFAVDVI